MADKDERSTIAAGCLMAMASALVTALMLFVNGSLVMALLSAFAENGPPWLSNPRFNQFVLFTVPVLLVIGQWIMIDYVRTRIAGKSH